MAGQQGRLVWIGAGQDEWVPGIVTAEHVKADVAGRTDMRGQPLSGQQLTTCFLPDTGDSVTVPESTLRPREPEGGGESLKSGLLGGGGSSPARGGLLGGAKAKAAALQARIGSPQQQQQQRSSRLPGSTGAPGEIRALREEAVLTVTTEDGQVEISAVVAAFGERVARLSNVPLIRAYPPLADTQLSNPHEIRGSIAVIARGRVPFVEKARRAQVADAVGVMFINDTDEPYVALGMDGDSDIVLPVVCVRRSDGADICEQIAKSKGVRHLCTASLSFGNSAAVSNELEAFLRNPSGAENIRDAAKKKMGVAGRAIASASEAARSGVKTSSPGNSEYMAAPSSASGLSEISPPRSSAAIVSEWISSRKPAQKGQKGQKAQKAQKASGLSMGLQLVDDSIYNQPAAVVPDPAQDPTPAHTSVQTTTAARAATPRAEATQETLTKLLSQHVPSTSSNARDVDLAAVPKMADSASVGPKTKSAGNMQALAAATANAAAVAEANAQQMQQQHDMELKEARDAAVQMQQRHDTELKKLREAAAQELQRVKAGVDAALEASNARFEAERTAHLDAASALQVERDAHGITREELAAAASAESQQLQNDQAGVELQIATLQQQLQEMQSLNQVLESERAHRGDESASLVATAVSRAVDEANQTWEAKLQSARRGFEIDLQEAEKQIEKYKSDSENGAAAAAEAVAHAVGDAQRKASEEQNSISRELAQVRCDLETERTSAERELAVLNAELEGLRRDAATSSSPRDALATEIKAAVDAANRVSGAKLRQAESSFEAQLADVSATADQAIAEVEQRLTETTSELNELRQRDESGAIQDAVDNAAREATAELDEMRQRWQASLAGAEASATAEKQQAEIRIAELEETAERAQAEFAAELANSKANEQAAIQQAVTETQAVADLKMQNAQKAHRYDLDEAAQIEQTLRSELSVVQDSSSEFSEESMKLHSLIAEKDAALRAATQEADAKLQKCIRDFEMSRDERDSNFVREMAETTESHQAASKATLDITVRKMQKQIDEANASTKLVESRLKQAKAAFDEDHSNWEARETSLSAELARTSAQNSELVGHLAESEGLVTEMSAELERIQAEQDTTAHASASDVVDVKLQIQQAQKAFDVDLKTAEAAAADKVDRIKEAAREKLEEMANARQLAESSLQTAVQERLQAQEQLEVAEQTIARMTTDLGHAETVLSGTVLEHNEAHQGLSEAQQHVADLRNELATCQAELEAERLASVENQTERDRVSDEMARALEAAHLKSDDAVQRTRQEFRLELEEAEAKGAKACSVVNEEATRQIAAAQQQSEESHRLREDAEATLLVAQQEHDATKRKLLDYIDGQDRVLELESQVEQLEAELVETAKNLGTSEDHHESLLERTRAAHAEALEGLQAKLESLGHAKTSAEEAAEEARRRTQLCEQEQSCTIEDEQNLRNELQEAHASHQQLKSELDRATSERESGSNSGIADLNAKLDTMSTDLKKSQDELFHTAEDAVATELNLKSELDEIRRSRDECNSKLAAAVAERENLLAQVDAAQHECNQLRVEAQDSKAESSSLNKATTARVAAIQAEKEQLEASVEKLTRQLRLESRPGAANNVVRSTVDSEKSSGASPAMRSQQEMSMHAEMHISPQELKPADDLAVASLQSEMEFLRSQLDQRAKENQNLQGQIHQLRQSHAQLADERSRRTSPVHNSQLLPAAADVEQVELPATPKKSPVSASKRASPQLGSPVRDHAAELETLEVMVHALRQEASAASSPAHSERGGSRLAGSPSVLNSHSGSQPHTTRSGEWTTQTSAQSSPAHLAQDLDDDAGYHNGYASSKGAVVDASRRLCEAVASGACTVVKELVQDRLSANALWDRTDGATLLHAAAFNGHAHIAKHLLSLSADVDRPMVNGATPVFAAAQQGHVDVLDELLSAGATVNWVSDDGSTPLYVAAWKGHAAVVSRLLSYGAHADRYHRERATPLFVAAQEGHAAVVRVLLDAGADPRRPWQDAHGRRWSPIDKAAANRHTSVVSILRESHALADGQHRPPLSDRKVRDVTRTPGQSPASTSRSPGSGTARTAGGPQHGTPRRPSPVRRHRSSRQARLPRPESTSWR